MVVFGGIGHIWGGVIGAIIVTIIDDLTRDYYQYRMVMFGSVIVLTVMFMPRGIGGIIDDFLVRRRFKAIRKPGRTGWRSQRRKPERMLLEVKNLTKRFGGMTAISKVDLTVKAGEVRGIIGPNGSGKITLFNLISGVYKPEPGGSILFDGEDITTWESHEIARRGIARTFQTAAHLCRHERDREHAGWTSRLDPLRHRPRPLSGRATVWREERRCAPR